MTVSVPLDELVRGIEDQSDSLAVYLDRETGEVVAVSSETLSFAEDDPELKGIDRWPGWQQEEAQLAQRIVTTERYLKLPDKFDINEWEIMRDYTDEAKSDKVRSALQDAIRGQGAFRRFKDRLNQYDLWDGWNLFKRAALEEIARAWCEENGITLKAASVK